MRPLVLALLAVGCTRPAEQRAAAELDIGQAAITDASVRIAGGRDAMAPPWNRRVRPGTSASCPRATPGSSSAGTRR